MTRILLILALATAVVAPRLAFAQPTPDQIEAAKKAFVDGKALHDQGKLAEAVDKFKESYRLSKNPLLLYNIGFTYDELKKSQQALVWYRKFLNEAPKDAAQRQEVTDRVKVIEKELEDAEINGGGTTQPDTTTTTTTTQPTTTTTQPTTDAHGKTIKPPGTYKADDFQHQIVTEAPPGKPLDLSAFVPEDSGFTVTMYFRGAGESAYTAKPMHWRYKELVARIPGAKMSGSSIQYYLEVKDATGAVVTRSGKSTSPNVVDVDASAPPRFYPDLVDNDTGAKPTTGDDNPLGGNQTTTKPTGTDDSNTTVTATAGGFGDVGSKKFRYLKWGTTGAAGALFVGSLVFYIEAGKQADALKQDAGLDANTGKPCTAPCHAFDGYDADLQSSGQRDQTLSRVFFGVGIAGAAVAGYLWWKEAKGAKHEAAQPATPPATNEMSWIVVPTAGDGFTGMAAAARF